MVQYEIQVKRDAYACITLGPYIQNTYIHQTMLHSVMHVKGMTNHSELAQGQLALYWAARKFSALKKGRSAQTYSCIAASEESGSIDSGFEPQCPQNWVMTKESKVTHYYMFSHLVVI